MRVESSRGYGTDCDGLGEEEREVEAERTKRVLERDERGFENAE